jgi:heterogeneous nuclear ribonucleoprotein A1/A3
MEPLTPTEKKRKFEEGDGPDAAPTLDAAAIHTLLRFISQETLLDVVKTEAAHSASLCRLLREKADEDATNRKLFVRGLAWETTSDQMMEVFLKYGPIEESIVCTDKGTGKSRGFGFVTFESVLGALEALKTEQHDIQGRTAYIRLAKEGADGKGTGQQQTANPPMMHGSYGAPVAAPMAPGVGDEDVTARKLFVRGLSWDTETAQLLEAFHQYGEIEEGTVCQDRATGKSKGFGFVTFKTRASTLAALATPGKMIGERMTQCKLASEGAPGKQQPQAVAAQPYGGYTAQPMYGAMYGAPQYGAPQYNQQPPAYGAAAYGAAPPPAYGSH